MLFNIILQDLVNSVKGNKSCTIGKEEIKLYLLRDDLIIQVEKKKIKKKKTLLEITSNSSKTVGYKINIQKSITFLNISNEQVEFEI